MSTTSAERYLGLAIEAVRRWLRLGDDGCREGLAGNVELRGLRDHARSLGETEVPLVRLRTRLELTDTEELAIWLLLAHELDHECRELLRNRNSEHAADVAVDSLRQLVYGTGGYRAACTELAKDSPLSRWLLVDRTDGAGQGATYRQTLAINPRVVSLACGELVLDPALDGIAGLGSVTTLWDDVIVADATRKACVEAVERGRALVVGGGGTGRRTLLSALVASSGCRVLEVDCAAIARELERSTLERTAVQLRTVQRESRLLGLTPVFVNLDVLATDDQRLQLVERASGERFLATASQPIGSRWRAAPATVTLRYPTGALRAMTWRRALPGLTDADCSALAGRYPIVPGVAVRAASLAQHRAAPRSASMCELGAAVDAVCDDRLRGLATRVEVTQAWDDLVLASDQREAVRELLARIRNRTRVYEEWGLGAKVGRGLGVVGLFSGPPGTGKTMTAGLIANAIAVPLYRVETSALVSKYIGETQKNLARLFDAAEGSHAIILFDEADALFAKRTEVRGSNDRHANQETNFLLQRLETFTGTCILTTNHDAALDDAFRRRVGVHIRFPAPDAAERKQIWSRMLACGIPTLGALRLEALAERYELSGGHIKNAVVRAAFLAADRGASVDHALLAQSAELEYEAIGKVVESPSTL